MLSPSESMRGARDVLGRRRVAACVWASGTRRGLREVL